MTEAEDISLPGGAESIRPMGLGEALRKFPLFDTWVILLCTHKGSLACYGQLFGASSLGLVANIATVSHIGEHSNDLGEWEARLDKAVKDVRVSSMK